MSQSQKKRNRREMRRRKRLSEKNERISSRQKREYIEEKVTLYALLKKHIVELLLIAVALIAVAFVIALGPDKKASQKLRESFDSFLYSRSVKWDAEFSQGYKIIVFTDTDIIHTSFNTLPDDLKINWKKMSVAWIQANQLNNTIEKIKITINDIAYTPANISGLAVSVTLLRQKGSVARLTRFGELEFVVKIVEDDGSQLFCLLGLKNM